MERYAPAAAKVDRGRFASPPGTPLEARAIPGGAANRVLKRYQVVKPVKVRAGRAAPWDGQPGLGYQWELPDTINNLEESGIIEPLVESVEAFGV